METSTLGGAAGEHDRIGGDQQDLSGSRPPVRNGPPRAWRASRTMVRASKPAGQVGGDDRLDVGTVEGEPVDRTAKRIPPRLRQQESAASRRRPWRRARRPTAGWRSRFGSGPPANRATTGRRLRPRSAAARASSVRRSLARPRSARAKTIIVAPVSAKKERATSQRGPARSCPSRHQPLVLEAAFFIELSGNAGGLLAPTTGSPS